MSTFMIQLTAPTDVINKAESVFLASGIAYSNKVVSGSDIMVTLESNIHTNYNGFIAEAHTIIDGLVRDHYLYPHSTETGGIYLSKSKNL